jgi:apolipoprotein N-acyltransferase
VVQSVSLDEYCDVSICGGWESSLSLSVGVTRRALLPTAQLLRNLGWALLAGLAQAASIAAPWNGQPLWWLQMLSLAALVMLLDRSASPKQAALIAWVFATSWLCGTVWWLFISMHVYGGLAAPLAALAVLALCGFLALYYAAAGYFYQRFRSLAGIKPAFNAILFAALWLLAELARDSWFTGFPWGAGGYAHVEGPFSWIASWIGVYGTGLIASLICSALVIRYKVEVKILLFALFLTLVVGYYLSPSSNWISSKPKSAQGVKDFKANLNRQSATSTTPSFTSAEITLLQGNIPQGEKFDATTGVKESLAWYQSQLMLSTASLVITPETAIPLLPRQLPEDYWQNLAQRFTQGEQAALIGIPQGDFETGYTNSALGLKPGQAQPYRYDKHHLVPFGEFIPPLFKWFTQMMNIPLGDFNRGAVAQPSFEWAGQRWAPNICYEDLFGDELARRFVDASKAPTVMVNMSNIGWFGNTVAIDQHLHISRMRALELGRPMVRATNTGATVIINHRGEITHSLPRHTKGVLIGQVEGRQGLTPYAQWAGRWGLWPLWGLGCLIVALFLIAHRAYSMPTNGLKQQKNSE